MAPMTPPLSPGNPTIPYTSVIHKNKELTIFLAGIIDEIRWYTTCICFTTLAPVVGRMLAY